MNLKIVNYNYNALSNQFKADIDISDCVYLFFENNVCKYIGETGASLKDRCYTHTPKLSAKPWFSQCDTIKIVILDNDEKSRKLIKKSFKCLYQLNP